MCVCVCVCVYVCVCVCLCLCLLCVCVCVSVSVECTISYYSKHTQHLHSSTYLCKILTLFLSVTGPSILLVLEGGAKIEVDLESYNVRRGTVLFISAGTEFKFSEKKQELVMFRAYCEL